ncbi:carbonate dehydratase [Microbulbifer agarilyticus]|uniref:Carbonic anhydrase n=1 Tax=Microbulbifer agarilyticus TaxID=260552 RepID=A0A1Q2MA80_9GAMM|nr:carbonate dehydratase [Microbulbifer agarilyticus]AQQ69569.1 carbonate dehydratase [Microbulbifer agarilyticus]
MSELRDLIEKNRNWSETTRAQAPEFFRDLSAQQSPDYLWIGSADSRVTPNQIVGLMPGELFVHRNVANVVAPSDLNCLSVLQYAVEVLQVKHILVVGHYGCGGVNAALEDTRMGLIESWLRHVKDVRDKHHTLIELFPQHQRGDLLCELNVLEQVIHVCQSPPVLDAWERGQKVAVHGWVYRLDNGLIKDLQLTIESPEQVNDIYHQALTGIAQRDKD